MCPTIAQTKKKHRSAFRRVSIAHKIESAKSGRTFALTSRAIYKYCTICSLYATRPGAVDVVSGQSRRANTHTSPRVSSRYHLVDTKFSRHPQKCIYTITGLYMLYICCPAICGNIILCTQAEKFVPITTALKRHIYVRQRTRSHWNRFYGLLCPWPPGDGVLAMGGTRAPAAISQEDFCHRQLLTPYICSGVKPDDMRGGTTCRIYRAYTSI